MNIVNVGYDSTNYYLIGDKTRLLIDVGWPGTFPKLLNMCKRKSVDFAEIKYLLATHYHPDHGGLAQEVKNNRVKLIMMENQPAAIPLMGKYMKPEQHYIEIDLQGNLDLRFNQSRTFLKSIGINGEIIPTPGHSDDSVSLILDEGLAFTGDLTGLKFAEDPNGQLKQSWELIKARGVKTVYPGHGPERPIEAFL